VRSYRVEFSHSRAITSLASLHLIRCSSVSGHAVRSPVPCRTPLVTQVETCRRRPGGTSSRSQRDKLPPLNRAKFSYATRDGRGCTIERSGSHLPRTSRNIRLGAANHTHWSHRFVSWRRDESGAVGYRKSRWAVWPGYEACHSMIVYRTVVSPRLQHEPVAWHHSIEQERRSVGGD